MRNVAGLRIPPGATDKGSIAYTVNVVLAENEDAVAEMGWQPYSVDRGFAAGDNVVTVQSVVSITPPCYSSGHSPLEHLETIGQIIGQNMAYRTATAVRAGKFFPLIVLSPSVARVLAAGGWSKHDVKRYLYENVKAPANFMEIRAQQGGKTTFNFCALVEEGGDPGRNQSKGYVENQKQGPPISKRIVLPARWAQLLEK